MGKPWEAELEWEEDPREGVISKANPCSNCGDPCCNGSDCYYKDEPELTPEQTEILRLTALLRECEEVVELASKSSTLGGIAILQTKAQSLHLKLAEFKEKP